MDCLCRWGHGLFGDVSETCRSAAVSDGGNSKHACHALSCIPAVVSEKANVEVGPARERQQPKIDLTPHESPWSDVGGQANWLHPFSEAELDWWAG